MYYARLVELLSEKIRAYRGYPFSLHDIKVLVRVWAKHKWPSFQQFLRKPTLVFPVEFALPDTEVLRLASELEARFPISITSFPVSALIANRHPSGEKLGKFLRKQLAAELRPQFDRAWDQFMAQIRLNGHVVITVHPIELLAISEFTTGWSSCHSVSTKLVGHFEANFLYATDRHTVLSYFYSSCDPHGIPLKRWRQLFYFCEDAIISSRQYPRDNKILAEFATKTILALFGLEAKYSWSPHVDVIEPDEFIPDNALPYLDTGYFTAYGPAVRKWLTLDFRTPIVQTDLFRRIATAFIHLCVECSLPVRDEEAIYLPDGNVICPECYDRLYVPCVACGRIIRKDRAQFDDDGWGYCPRCLNEMATCIVCGHRAYYRFLNRAYSPARNSLVYLCHVCATRVARCDCGQLVLQEGPACSCGREL